MQSIIKQNMNAVPIISMTQYDNLSPSSQGRHIGRYVAFQSMTNMIGITFTLQVLNILNDSILLFTNIVSGKLMFSIFSSLLIMLFNNITML